MMFARGSSNIGDLILGEHPQISSGIHHAQRDVALCRMEAKVLNTNNVARCRLQWQDVHALLPR